MTNPFRAWVDGYAASLRAAAAIQPPRTAVPPASGGRLALIFAPHPDDEVIVGALPLRLRREAGWRVCAVAVTLGSRPDRRAARAGEMAAACDALGFGLIHADPAGLERISPAGRDGDPANWNAAVGTMAELLRRERPDLVALPHAADWNQTHLGVHRLLLDAFARLPGLDLPVLETEFWGAMDRPNLMVESSPADVADLVAALALHVGEVARNPYHLRLPAWMIDNVRRGAELVGGQGGAAPDWPFATLYRLRRWCGGEWREALSGGTRLPAAESAAAFIEASLFSHRPGG